MARRARGQMEVAFGGPERTRVIVVLAAVLAMSSADAATVGAAATQLRRALHVDNTDIGLLVTVSSLVAAAASLPFGVLADRVKRTRTLGITVLAWGVAMIGSALTTSFGELLVARLVLGVVTASAGPIVASMIGDYFPSGERGRVYSYILTGELAGAGIGFAVTGDVAALSWRAAFVLLALPTFFLARALFRLPEPVRGGIRPLARDDDLADDDLAGDDLDDDDLDDLDDDGLADDGLDDDGLADGGLAGRDAPVGTHGGAGGAPWESSPPVGWAPIDPVGIGVLGAPADTPPKPPAAAASLLETEAQRLAREQGIEPDADRVLHRDPRDMGIVEATRYLLSIRTNVILIVASACCYFYLSGIETFASEFTSEQYGIPQALANILILVVGIGAVVGVLVGGGLSDYLLKKRYLNGRVLIAAIAALMTTVLFVPAILTRNTITALPYLTLAGFALMAQNPAIDAARLDIVPPLLWGRAEGLRTLLRTAAQSLAPVLFGAFADLLGGRRAGLQWTFLVMLVPLLANGVVLMLALRTYPRDVATAAAAPPPPAR